MIDIVSIFTLLLDFVLHIDEHLISISSTYGIWIYAILFLIIFLETGLVITPFLPGDSMLFAAGALAAIGTLKVIPLFILLCIAAILGDTVNYWIGHYFGLKVFKEKNKILKKSYLDKTSEFYKKYGRKTIVLARFMPIVRTFAPFVAGACIMNYKSFFSFNIIGGIAWTALFVFGGYLFGNIPIVRDNFELVILAIILLSILPAIVEYLRNRK